MYGFSVAFSLENLWWCFFGVFMGTFLGVLPGIGALAAVSMLLPISFYLEPVAALIMLAGVYYGGEYGGSTASILLNLPGSPSNAVACLDGYPMARQGRAGVALFITTIASFVGGSIGIIALIFLTPTIVSVALSFGSSEYFALMLFGLLVTATASQDSPAKGIAMTFLGVLLGTVGSDMTSGVIRFTFNYIQLSEGISVVVLAMGLFGVAELLSAINTVHGSVSQKVSLRSMIPSREDMRRSTLPMLRGTGIGALFGTLPGTGPTIASFMSYMVEKRISKEPSRFGKGAIEGLASPEASNNASVQTAFIPTLALGIPGSPVMAVMLGAMMIHGIAPGPTLVSRHADLFWGVVASFWIGNLLLLILNIPLIGLWVRLISIPYKYLYPAILIFVCIGIYSVRMSVFDVWLVLMFGVLGYGMRVLDFHPAPLLMGFILGPLMEQNLRRSMTLVRGDVMILVQRPGTMIILIVMTLTMALLAWSSYRAARRAKEIDAVRTGESSDST